MKLLSANHIASRIFSILVTSFQHQKTQQNNIEQYHFTLLLSSPYRMLPLSPKPHTATTAAVASIQRPTCDWNCPFTIFLGGNKKYNRQFINNFLPLLKSSANEWERAKTIKNKQYKCSTQNAIALNCYNQWIGKGEQYKFASSATSFQLTSADEVIPHLLKCLMLEAI